MASILISKFFKVARISVVSGEGADGWTVKFVILDSKDFKMDKMSAENCGVEVGCGSAGAKVVGFAVPGVSGCCCAGSGEWVSRIGVSFGGSDCGERGVGGMRGGIWLGGGGGDWGGGDCGNGGVCGGGD
ncbi:glycine-rich cell wall structural protein 1-like [Hevea brasiliensis]|uniref:glycine-rich cell wall structural protein 1-like n=1 Tax=Hevea brasiliensis TaxID=3981 RepID=UPI0025E474A9|nr:glycine-rich cell wall structural protein 1-like [Hevea brasiliensis]